MRGAAADRNKQRDARIESIRAQRCGFELSRAEQARARLALEAACSLA